ncbi:dethiobiotin synthase [Staphylococcus lutrae]|uniref:ATP-dependent dethiobiotin synthetase BioD n=1 Tax=Staphylococcus lutrae TaxID=155085 RepID=A0AAC9RTF1_9STAP|nr:dethiobiotin synthase [Staphylococcus lutrae]ARJ50799.1 dethiobiotin synthase [Staphylococcus lutrae]PNZ34010.1 dethiobiotin synthase [Staphylococcus lutrae]
MKCFITSTNTDIGKTYVTTRLYHYLTQQGLKVHIIKPFQTEVRADGTYPDLSCYQQMCDLPYEDTGFYTFAPPVSPHLAFQLEPQQQFDRAAMMAWVDAWHERCDVLLIEGAGGVAVPIYEGEQDFYMTADLIRDTADGVITVLPSKLGAISDALVHHHYVSTMQLPQTIFLMNRYTHTAIERDNHRTIEKYTGRRVEIFPEAGTSADFSTTLLKQMKEWK